MLREDEHYADKIPLVNTSCNTSNEHEESREHEEEVSNQTESAAAATEPVNNLYGNSNIKNKTRLNPTLAKFYKRHCIYSSYRHTNNYSKLYLNNSAFKHYYNKKHKQFSDSLKYYKWYYHHQHHLHSKKEQQQVSWIPPINADTLEELSISHMFKSLQLRHDLLSDPHLYFRPNLDGPSGREKRKRADRYWKRVECAFQHDQEYDFLRIIMLELVKILKTLINPFENHSVLSSTFRWNFPDYISAENLQDIFDPELMIQQLKFNCLDISKQLSCLELIFQHLCPNQPLIEVMKQYFIENSFAKALRQCFIILEIIKLDCANRILRHYRHLLIESCAEFEYQYFIKQNDQTQYIKSAYQWLHSLYQTQGEQSFENIYYHGLVHLVSDDEETVRALSLKAHNFPMTLKFDQRRMTHQFRYEFQNMIVISILIIPYRHLIGKEDHVDNLTKLKQVYNTLLKKKNSCHHLALHACEAAQKPETVAFWEEWLSHNLQSNSSIFRLMYERICQQLVFYTRHNKLDDHVPFTGLEDEIVMLGSKLKAIAKLNLDVFGNLYKNVAKEILNDSS